jgi:hypothetical protein
MASQTIRTSEKEEAILAALREKPVYSAACRKARVSRAAIHEWRRDDPAFADRVLVAREEGYDALEDALGERGLIDDTTAAIFMLKSHRRAVYGDRIDHNHRGLIAFASDWVVVRAAIYDALAPYPDALAAVLGRLAALGAGDE